ncbi:hypothetical protein PSPO01_09238 [Paraphaeosphaeria sporulosa]
MTEAVGSTASVLFTPGVGNGRLVQVSEGAEGIEDEGLAACDDKDSEEERLGFVAPPELEEKTTEELLIPNEDVLEELWLDISELVVLEVELADDVVLTNPSGGGGIIADLVAVIVVADVEPKGIVDVLIKVTVVDIELGLESVLEDLVADDMPPLETVRVTVEPEIILCRTVDGVKCVTGEEGDGLPLDVSEVTGDATWDVVPPEGTVGRVGARIELGMGKVSKEDAGAGLGTEGLLKLLEGTSTPEVADGLGKDTVN